MRTVMVILFGSILAFAVGCENASGRLSLLKEMTALKQEKMQFANQAKQSKAEAEQLKKQVEVLSGLKEEERLESFYNLRKINVTNYTNFYDKDRNGVKEKLIVYIQPVDEEGDAVKASGAVDVQLWDLNNKDGQALLDQWRVEPNELKKLWFTTLMTVNYRLTFDVADKITGLKEPLTVKVTFTDYLSGKVFTEQKVLKP